MSEQIKRVNRELKFKGTIIDFYQDTMEINGDHTVVWDFIKHKGAAAVVPVTEDGKILMVRQYRNALERYTLEIPAGALDEEGGGLEIVLLGNWKKKQVIKVRNWNG